MKKITFVGVLMILLFSGIGWTQEAGDEGVRAGRGSMRTPPQEAISACEGVNSGEACEFAAPTGDQITGTCGECRSGEFACRPDRPMHRRGGYKAKSSAER